MGPWLLSAPSLICWTAIAMTATLLHARFGWKGAASALASGTGGLLLVYSLISVPLPKDISLTGAAEVFDRHGRSIGTYDETRRTIVDIGELPSYVRDAVVAAEDKDFLEHGGIAYKGLLRAALRNLSSGKIEQGGSTITQQYVKVALLRDNSRNIVRKIKEAALASKLEDRYTKDQILSFYLNTIYLGRGSYGIEAAARTYFDKHAAALTRPEAIYLAGIIRAPEAHQLDQDPEAAETRYMQVVDALHRQGLIGETKTERLKKSLPELRPGVDIRASEQVAAYFLEWLRRSYLQERFGYCLQTCGLKIHTTLDLQMQRAAERAVTESLDRKNDPQGALVAMTPGGAIRAFVGGRDVQNIAAAKGFNFAADLPGREAGSTFKPFALAAALSEGLSISTVISGASPAVIESDQCAQNQSPWQVSNYGGMSYGGMSLYGALAYSVNTVFARVASDIGPASIAEVAARLGFDRAGAESERQIQENCSLALGSIDVTPVELTRAYAAFASGGVLPPVRAINHIDAEDGGCLISFTGDPDECEEKVDQKGKRVFPGAVAAAVTDAMKSVITHGTGRAAAIGTPAAGKTGTSQNNRDAWFAGYVPSLVTSVWVGHPLNDRDVVPEMRSCNKRRCLPVRREDVTGGGLPARIWQAFMEEVAPREKPKSIGPELPPTIAKDAGTLPLDQESSKEPTNQPPPEPAPSPSGGIPLIDELPIPERRWWTPEPRTTSQRKPRALQRRFPGHYY